MHCSGKVKLPQIRAIAPLLSRLHFDSFNEEDTEDTRDSRWTNRHHCAGGAYEMLH